MKKNSVLTSLTYLVFSILVVSWSSNLAAESVVKLDKIVAIVNNEIITQSQLSAEITGFKKQLEHTNSPIPPHQELRKQVLDHLIDKNLQLQVLKARHISVTEEDVKKAIESIAKQNKMSLPQFKQALQASGISFDEFQTRIKEQVALQRVQQQEVAKNVTISENEVNEFMRKTREEHNYSAFHLIDILVSTEDDKSPSSKTAAQKQANLIASQLKKGFTPETYINYQKDVQYNDLGWRNMQDIPTQFVAEVQKMKVGGVSSPIQAPNGFHVLKLMNARGSDVVLTKKEAQNMLFQKKMIEAIRDWTKQLRTAAFIKIMD